MGHGGWRMGVGGGKIGSERTRYHPTRRTRCREVIFRHSGESIKGGFCLLPVDVAERTCLPFLPI